MAQGIKRISSSNSPFAPRQSGAIPNPTIGKQSAQIDRQFNPNITDNTANNLAQLVQQFSETYARHSLQEKPVKDLMSQKVAEVMGKAGVLDYSPKSPEEAMAYEVGIGEGKGSRFMTLLNARLEASNTPEELEQALVSAREEAGLTGDITEAMAIGIVPKVAEGMASVRARQLTLEAQKLQQDQLQARSDIIDEQVNNGVSWSDAFQMTKERFSGVLSKDQMTAQDLSKVEQLAEDSKRLITLADDPNEALRLSANVLNAYEGLRKRDRQGISIETTKHADAFNRGYTEASKAMSEAMALRTKKMQEGAENILLEGQTLYNEGRTTIESVGALYDKVKKSLSPKDRQQYSSFIAREMERKIQKAMEEPKDNPVVYSIMASTVSPDVITSEERAMSALAQLEQRKADGSLNTDTYLKLRDRLQRIRDDLKSNQKSLEETKDKQSGAFKTNTLRMDNELYSMALNDFERLRETHRDSPEALSAVNQAWSKVLQNRALWLQEHAGMTPQEFEASPNKNYSFMSDFNNEVSMALGNLKASSLDSDAALKINMEKITRLENRGNGIASGTAGDKEELNKLYTERDAILKARRRGR